MSRKSVSRGRLRRSVSNVFSQEMLESRTLFATVMSQAVPTGIANNIPVLNSLPGAPANLYLDFNGNNNFESYMKVEEQVYDLDNDISSFNEAEVAAIREIWTRVADAFAPFNINVTTVDPGPDNYAGKTLNAIIGGTSDTAGGHALINGFTKDKNNAGFTISGDPRLAAITVVHEAGHGFGLDHQSEYDSAGNFVAEYRGELGDVGPIMGAYSRERAIWSDGPTRSATLLQDDMAIIARPANGFGYRPDDYANTADAASPLAIVNGQASVAGVIHHDSDQDWFQFSWPGGPLTLSVQGPTETSFLNAKADLFNTSGTLLSSLSDPATAEFRRLDLTAGTYRIRVGSTPYTDSRGMHTYGEAGQYLLRIQGAPASAETAQQIPFTLNAPVVSGSEPVTIQAEDFDIGGPGVAYSTTFPFGFSGASGYRSESQIDYRFDATVGTFLNYSLSKSGDWTEYTVDVRDAGTYDLVLGLKSSVTNIGMKLTVDGVFSAGGTFGLPATNGWDTRQVTRVQLPAGVHVLRFTLDGHDPNTPSSVVTTAMDFFRLVPVTSAATQTPFLGTPLQVHRTQTTVIQAEDFDRGGEGVAYHDLTSQNTGGVTYRADEGVDVKVTTDTSLAAGSYRLSDAAAGEWLEYTFDVADAYDYRFSFRAGSPAAGGVFHAEVDGVNVTGALSVPNTGSYDKMVDIVSNAVVLMPGRHVLRLVMDTNAATGGAVGGFNAIRIVPNIENPVLVVSPTSGLTISEGGTDSFTVQLATQPTATTIVQVTRTSSVNSDLFTFTKLYFTPANWNTPQPVFITGYEDDDNINGSATFAVTAPGAQTINVTVQEMDHYQPDVVPIQLRAVADAHVRDGSYAGQNFGSATELQLKKSGTGSNREMLLKFDLANIDAVGEAFLRLYGRIDSAAEKPSVAVYGATTNLNWSETGVTWNTRPGSGTAGRSTTTIATSTSKWYEWDVTSFLQAQKAAGATSVTLVVRSLAATEPYMIFNSDEAATNRPLLVVVPGTTPPATPSIVLSTQQLAVAEGNGSAVTVKLNAKPTSNVIVNISRTSGDGDLTTAAGSVTFTPDNWSTPQSVLISAAEDADSTNGSAVFSFAASGLTTAMLTATEVDNDTNPAVSLHAVADAYVRDGGSASQNFGSATELQLKKSGTGSNREIVLKFDLTTLSSVAVAKLRLFGRIDSSTEKPAVSVYGATTNLNWTETGVTWNTRPGTGTAAALATATIATSTPKWYEWDVTSFLQAQKQAGATSVTLVVRPLASTEPYMIFNSDEAATNRPELLVTLSSEPETPAEQHLVLSVPPEGLTVPEGGSVSFTAKLATKPTGDVTVTVFNGGVNHGDPDLTASPTTLTFTQNNWNVPQTVTIFAAQDADAIDTTATFALTSEQEDIGSVLFDVKERDDDIVRNVALRPTADAHARDGGYASQNFGSATELQLKKGASGSNREVFLKFDLSTLTSVSSAKLRLHGRIDSSTQKPSVGVFAASDTNWTETGVNWNNRPSATGTAIATVTVATSASKYYEWDVTDYLKAQKAAGAQTVTLVLRSLTTTDPYIIFSSDEAAANRPELAVTL